MARTDPLQLPGTALDPAVVLALLPHRYPLLLVDRLSVVDPGRRVVGVKTVTGGEWLAAPRSGTDAGPMPPAMPALLVVEALAQASAGLLMDLVDSAAGAVGYFAAMQRVRLRAAPRPGDTITLVVELQSFRRGIARLRGTATVDGRLVASADFTTVVRAR